MQGTAGLRGVFLLSDSACPEAEMHSANARPLCLAFCIFCASLIMGASAQQRTTQLAWSGQVLRAGHFRVHEVAVFAAAESLEVVVSAEAMQHVGAVNIWLRHGAPPTPNEHYVHAALHRRGRFGTGKKHEVGLHVKNPLQGRWYIAVSAAAAGMHQEQPAMEATSHRFLKEHGRAVYSVSTTTSGCERGRFGFPRCDANWMQLSWGKEARFHGVLQPGTDVWT